MLYEHTVRTPRQALPLSRAFSLAFWRSLRTARSACTAGVASWVE
jgi:hypothetical protein